MASHKCTICNINDGFGVNFGGFVGSLFDQLVTWTEELGFSPDRLDAMVWPAWHQRLVNTRLRGEAKFGGATAQLRIVS